MDEVRLRAALEKSVGADLAKELVSDFMKIRRDLATSTLERASTGKFVEVFVRCLQQLATGAHQAAPSIDHYLDKVVETTGLPDGLRVCAARIARSIYTLRNKRNVAHKNEVDANTHDLAFAHQGASWIMSELLRNASGISMQEAGFLVAMVQAPVGPLIEDIGDVRLVHADVSVRDEILILLHSHYPAVVPQSDILRSLSRRDSASVQKRLRELHSDKLAHGSARDGYKLTTAGHAAAAAQIGRIVH